MVGASSTWFDQWLAFLQPKAVKVSDLVALNPDDPPLPSPADLVAAVTPPYLGIPAILNYMWAKLSYYEFTQVAICNAGAPTCVGAALADGTFSGTNCSSSVTWEFGNTWAIDTDCYSPGVFCWNFGGSGFTTQARMWSSSGTLLATASSVSVPSGGGHGYAAWDAGPVTLTHGNNYIVSVNEGTFNCVAYNASANNWLIGTLAHGVGGAHSTPWHTFPNTSHTYTIGCQPELCVAGSTSTPPNASSPSQPTTIVIAPTLSCGSTADLCTAVRQLDQRLTQIYSLVTLVQRSAVPYAYIPGAVHSGLTGTGSFAISQLLGLRIQLSSTHTGEPILPGNPPYLWDQGWLSVNDANGMLEEKRLTRTGMEWFPKFCHTATSFNWTVAAGVTMVVTELEAEP